MFLNQEVLPNLKKKKVLEGCYDSEKVRNTDLRCWVHRTKGQPHVILLLLPNSDGYQKIMIFTIWQQLKGHQITLILFCLAVSNSLYFFKYPALLTFNIACILFSLLNKII